MSASDPTTALILPGGGARAAYQVGVLRALARLTARGAPLPFAILCGTSAGAINAATLALAADDFRQGVARLVRWWRRVDAGAVYRADLASLSRHGMRWLAHVLGGRAGPAQAAAMLDNAPLERLLRRALAFEGLDAQISSGRLRALAINATSYATGRAVTHFQGAPELLPWHRTRREGRAVRLAVEHLMASTAIPFVFPAVRIGHDWFMDGSVRHLTPLAPALRLGARRVLVVPVGQFVGQAPDPDAAGEGTPRYPSFAQTAGHALSTIFLDNLGADLERLDQLNALVDATSPAELARRGLALARVEALVSGPSVDLGLAARPYADRLPAGVRYLLGGLGSTRGTGANLMSYLMFEPGYVRTLLRLGYRDAWARRVELCAFLERGGTPLCRRARRASVLDLPVQS